ncbi:hypothetical protein KZZ04_20720, partial [Pseudoalteromonas sp. CR1]|nr:hypothetical protein [Pseudoalteromonas sp. CR1]
MPFQPWASLGAAIGAIHQATFRLPTFAGLARCSGQATRSAIDPDLDLFSREALWQLDAHLRARRAW